MEGHCLHLSHCAHFAMRSVQIQRQIVAIIYRRREFANRCLCDRSKGGAFQLVYYSGVS